MPLSYTELESSPFKKLAKFYCAKEFVRIKVDSATEKQLPFPSDYKFSQCFLPKKYLAQANRIENFRVNADDVWVVSFPKAGTTWTLNIVSYLMNNLDFSVDYKTELDSFFERAMYSEINDENKNDQEYLAFVQQVDQLLDTFDKEPSPRLFKTHLPAYLLPKDVWSVKSKMIYVYRDAKDVAISMYHMFKNIALMNFQGDLHDYFDIFLNDHVVYGKFYDHIYSFWQLQHMENVLFIKYDDMIVDPLAGVKKISTFLNHKYNDEQLQKIVEHVSFQNMSQKSKDLNYYSNGYR